MIISSKTDECFNDDNVLRILELLFPDFPGRGDTRDLAGVGGQHHGRVPPAAGPQRFGQPPALLLLRQTLLGHHPEDPEEMVRLALHHEDGDD